MYLSLLLVLVSFASLAVYAHDVMPEQQRVVSLVYNLYQQGKHITVKTSSQSCISDPRTERVLKLGRKESADFLKNSGTLSSLISQYTPEHLAQELPLDLTAIDVKEFKTLQQWLKGVFPTHTDDELRKTLRAADLLSIRKEYLLNVLQHVPLRQLCSLWLSDRDIADYPLKSLASVGPLFEKYLQEKSDSQGYLQIKNIYEKTSRVVSECLKAISADGKTRVTASTTNHTAIVWQQNESGEWLAQWLGVAGNDDEAVGHLSGVYAAALSADGNLVVTGSADCTAIVWQRIQKKGWKLVQRLGTIGKEGREVGHVSGIDSTAISTDGTRIVTGSVDHTIIVWEQDVSGKWQVARQLGISNNKVRPARYGNDEEVVAISADGTIRVTASRSVYSSMGYSAAVWQQGESGRLQLVQRLVVDGKGDAAFTYKMQRFGSIAISADGRIILTGSTDHTVIVWRQDESGKWQFDRRLGTVGNECHGGGHVKSIRSIALSVDSRTVATGSEDGIVILWQKEDIDAFCQRVAEHPLG